jgi:spore germination protein
MKKLWKNVGIALAISIPLILAILYIDSQHRVEQAKDFEKIEQEQKKYSETNLDAGISSLLGSEEQECATCSSSIEEASLNEIKHIGWIPSWDYKNALNSITASNISFDSISPVAFQVEGDGSLKARMNVNVEELRNKNFKIIPTISNFDWNVMKSIFDSPENTQRHINSILSVVKNNNYDGIDLDYESLKLENKEHFLNFVKTLSEELHKNEKILSITVLPKWEDDVYYTGFAETRKVQDWGYIGNYADQVRIMTYDFTPPGNSTEGPIAPIDWMEKVLKYATEKMPRKKIWLGVHLYAYEWVMPTKDSKDNVIKMNSYTYQTVKSRILNHDYVKSRYDESFQEGFAEYTCGENNYCLLYYQTPEGVNARKNLAQKYDIAGLAYWRLGGEDDLLR